MLQSELALQARLLAGARQLPPPDTSRVAEVAPLAAVASVIGKVEAQLRDGRFQVLVEGRSIALKLPPDTRVGQQVRLVRMPDSIDAYGLAEAPEHDAGVATSVSAGGRMLAALLAKPPDPGAPRAGTARPILESFTLPRVEMALKLAQALGSSGLFYEAHQAGWLDGQRSLASLLEEPQGRLSPRLAAPDNFPRDKGTPPSGRTAEAGPDASRIADFRASAPRAHAGETTAKSVMPDSSEPGASRAADLAARTGPRTAEAPTHPATESIIQQQISTLETGQIVWHGQIWPGQDMEWRIGEAPQEGGQEAAESGWQTTLELDLTILGPIEAQLQLRADKIAIRLGTEDDAVQDLFQLRAPDLVQAMNDAGLAVSKLEVRVRVG